MAKDIHVTSRAIRQLGNDLVEDVAPAFGPVENKVNDANIESPGFGLMLDPVFRPAYESARQYAHDYIEAGKQQLTSYQTTLHEVATTREKAEYANTVRFR